MSDPRRTVRNVNRIDLRHIRHQARLQWTRGQPGDVDHATFQIGQLNGGDWYVAKVEAGTTMAWIAANADHAGDVVQQWIRRRGGSSKWRPVEPSDQPPLK
jgi:hypothetical protein